MTELQVIQLIDDMQMRLEAAFNKLTLAQIEAADGLTQYQTMVECFRNVVAGERKRKEVAELERWMNL